MAAATQDFLLAGIGGHPVGARLADWLAAWPAKELARLFPGVEYRTCAGWKAGRLPQNRHWIAMAERWGAAFLLFVFAPVLEQGRGYEERLEMIERESALLRREIADERAARAAAPGNERAALEAGGVAGGARRGASAGLADVAARAARTAVVGLCLAAGVIQAVAPDAEMAAARPAAARLARGRLDEVPA